MGVFTVIGGNEAKAAVSGEPGNPGWRPGIRYQLSVTLGKSPWLTVDHCKSLLGERTL